MTPRCSKRMIFLCCFIVGVFLMTCNKDTSTRYKECWDDEECGAGEFCMDESYCTVACTIEYDEETGQFNVYDESCGQEAKCEFGWACKGPETDAFYQSCCFVKCHTDDDCPAGMNCTDKTCGDSESIETDPNGNADADADMDSDVDADTDADADSDSDTGDHTGGFGASCTEDDEVCAEFEIATDCVMIPLTAEGYCTVENCTAEDCPETWQCCDCTNSSILVWNACVKDEDAVLASGIGECSCSK